MGITLQGGGQKTPKRTEHTAGNNLLRCITVFDADTVERGNRNGDKLPCPCLEVLWELFGAGKLSW